MSKRALLVIILVLAGCATVPSASDYDTTAKFPSYFTFALMQRQRGPAADSQTLRQTEEAIRTYLRSKGFEPVSTPEKADFVVDFTLGAADRTDIHSYPAAYAGSWFWDARLRGGPYWGPDIDPAVYGSGILSIDIFDQKTHRPVWHGWSKQPFSQQTVGEVLSWFPPGHMQ